MRGTIFYDEPYAWWGPVWTEPSTRDLLDLIRDGVMSAAEAALLWALVARRVSIVVASGPRSAGKTTLLTAMLDFLPTATNRLYLRGAHETFAFLDDQRIEPTRSALLVNEISGHLPIYLWGPAVRRVLAATRRGFSLMATAHAQRAEDFVSLLAGYPLRLHPTEIGAIEFIVMLDRSERELDNRCRVSGIWQLTSGIGNSGLTLVNWQAAGSDYGDLPIPRVELAERTRELRQLVESHADQPRRRGWLGLELARLGQQWDAHRSDLQCGIAGAPFGKNRASSTGDKTYVASG